MKEYPLPPFFAASLKGAGDIRRVKYNEIIPAGEAWAKMQGLDPAAVDGKRVALMIIDGQLTFCHPDFELPVTGATDDMARLASFIYRNIGNITRSYATLDTHTMMQIFHQIFLINDKGEHPTPGIPISDADVQQGVWKVNPAVADIAQGNLSALQKHLVHYTGELAKGGRLSLMPWDYHAMLGGIGHALIPILEEAICFHGAARAAQPWFEIKGGNPLTENYSVGRQEVLTTHGGVPIASMNSKFFGLVAANDRIVVGGEAGSHCVAWSLADLIAFLKEKGLDALISKIYVLEDCMSPVIIPGVIDFTDMMKATFDGFRKEGVHFVSSTTPMASWPEF